MNNSQALQKLSIKTEDGSKEFKVLINPASITNAVTVNYSPPARSGNGVGQSAPYNNTEPEDLSFALDFDGTGAISSPAIEVDREIQKLKDVTLKYDGEKHEPNVVIISWGSLVIKCRLKSISINYSLFKPDGKPLRAKVTLAFMGHMDESEAARKRNNSSPDLSHVLVVKSGDTLPLMCQKIYGDSGMYLEVARVNGLVNFRSLKEGTEILFPPIKQ